uniref:Reverse transcriptase domain-containing protein n=1 Tax=Strongyloides venezuelensis TaxID=75913 RepID=A0A0K0FI02_STRVS
MRTSGGRNLSKEKKSTPEAGKSVIEKLNHDHGYKIINCDYERRRIKRIVEKRLANYEKENSNIVDEESTTQKEKDLSFHKSWLSNIQLSEKSVDVAKMMKVYYESMVAKVKRICGINQVEDMFEKACIKSSKSFIKVPKKLNINKYTAPVWMLVDNLLQAKLQVKEYKDNYENGLKVISAAMYTISQLTTFNSERTTKNKIKKLRKMILNGRSKVEVLKTIKTRPSSEAASILNELRLRFPKRKNYKVKEFIQFLEWNIRSKELDLARIEKNEKRKMLRLAYSKTPSIKLIRKLSGIRSNSNTTEVQLSTAVEYYENLFKGKKILDISDFKNYCNNIKNKFSQVDIDKDELREDILLAINEASPWKAAGNDLLPCAAFKHLKAGKLWAINMIEKVILEGMKLPDFAYEGKTFLLFKSGNPEDPSCYRPITVLNSFTKLLSSTINKQIHRYCGRLIQINQMANKPELWGTATAKYIDSTIAMDSKAAKKPLHMAWIDYTKAYDSWKSVIEKLNHDYGYKIINCDYERRRIKRIVEKRLANYEKENSNIVDEESTTQKEKDLSFHKSWLSNIQPSEKSVDVAKMMKVYYGSMVAKVKRICDINQVEDMFEKACIKSSKSFIKVPKKLIINKYTAPVWMLVDNLLQAKLQVKEYKDNYENGLKVISAAMYTISQLTTFNSERTTKNKIKKLRKMILNGRRKVEVLKTIKTRPSSEAASILNELRLRFPKRKNYKVKEFIQFLEWNIRSKELDLTRIEKNEKRKMLRLAYSKTPSIKLIRKLSGIRSNSNTTEVQLSTAVEYYENLFKGKKILDISDFKNYCNNIKNKFSQVDIDKDELREDILLAINEASPWKAAGNDLLPCAAFKHLKAGKLWAINMIEKVILEGMKLPDFAYEGKTFLLFKSGNPEDPSCYRPITVLNSFTKLLSSTINKQIHRYCGRLIQINQIANKPELWGTATAKYIDSTIAMDSKAAKKPLHMAWID